MAEICPGGGGYLLSAEGGKALGGVADQSGGEGAGGEITGEGGVMLGGPAAQFGGGVPCEDCLGITPASWAVHVEGLTGDCAGMNGDYDVPQNPEMICEWRLWVTESDVVVVFFIDGNVNVSLNFSSFSDVLQFAYPFSGDCCAAYSLAYTEDFGCNTSAIVTITPNCLVG